MGYRRGRRGMGNARAYVVVSQDWMPTQELRGYYGVAKLFEELGFVGAVDVRCNSGL